MMAFNQEMSADLRNQIEMCFQDIPRQCEGVERFDLVDNRSRTSASYTHALLSVFSSEGALDAYRVSDAHANLMAQLGPHIKEIVVLDSFLRSGQSV
jgi:quinol monooxygenase YgiN